ncbi:MAG: TRZ/ATZ family hydrolase [Burkholderiales bacterium]|nr:TRZ/ATZ family hydrolase [Burkholderiales bacterium]
MDDVDTLINARWVIPVEPGGAVLPAHSVAIRADRIVALLPQSEAAERFNAAAVFDLADHALIPGLVNLHTHAAMSLMRGLADDLPLMTWLKHHIWPAEARHVSPGFVYDGTLLACAEMLRGGITCFNDMYFYPEEVARAALDAGMRAAVGIIAIEMPTRYASDAQDYLAKGLSARDAFRGEPLVSFCMAPHAPYTVSDQTFRRVVTMAEELDLPIHTHLHETREEIQSGESTHSLRPLARLLELGVLGPRLIAAHAVHLLDSEIELLARHGASVAHCPSSNLKLASGFAQVARMERAGVGLGLGTDGAASNNRLDMFCEMRMAALLAKAVAGDAQAFPAARVLQAATLEGARALGLDRLSGSIVPGKWADLCAVAFNDPALAPCYDPLSHLVYCAGRESVSHVWVAGQLRVEERNVTGLEIPALNTRARLWQNKLVEETKA